MELKQEEFRSLRMGSMTVAEYHDTFEQLARYAPNDVREDADKQRLFMKGLYYELRLQLVGNTYPTFQGSGSNNRQHFSSQQGYQQRFQ